MKERFGDPQVLIFRHVEELYNLSPPSPNVTVDLWQLYNTLHSHVRSLQMLGVQGSQYGILLTPIMLTKLPMECQLEWARNSLGKVIWISFKVVCMKSSSDVIVPPAILVENVSPQQTVHNRPHRPAAATLYSAVGTAPVHCVLCSGSHPISQCSQFLQLAYIAGEEMSVIVIYCVMPA